MVAALEVEVAEAMRRVLLCMLEAVEGEICLPGGGGGDVQHATEHAVRCRLSSEIVAIFSLQSAAQEFSGLSGMNISLIRL